MRQDIISGFRGFVAAFVIVATPLLQGDDALPVPAPGAGQAVAGTPDGQDASLTAGSAVETATVGAAEPDLQSNDSAEVANDGKAAVEEIFDKYIQSLGGERALRRNTSRITKGTIEANRRKADYEIHQAPGGRFMLIQYFPEAAFRMGYDGTNAWRQTGEQPWESLPEEDGFAERFDNDLQAMLNWREEFVQTELLPRTEVNGRETYAVLTTLRSGQQRTFYFDTGTHRLVRTTWVLPSEGGEPIDVEVFPKDYRTVDGVVVPFLTVTHVGGDSLISRVRSVEQNLPININLLSPPLREGVGGGYKDSERFFEALTIGEISYTNVWVHRQTNYNVLIRHAGGIQTIRLTDLPKGDLEALRPQLGDWANIDEGGAAELMARFTDLQGSEEYRGELEAHMQTLRQLIEMLWIPIVVVMLLLHLLFSFFVHTLCHKTKTSPGIEAWLPLCNQSAMMRAAGMLGIWPLLGVTGYLLPAATFAGHFIDPVSPMGFAVGGIGLLMILVSSVMWVVWCFKICLARQKSGWLGVLLLIPGVNLVTFTYLTFAD